MHSILLMAGQWESSLKGVQRTAQIQLELHDRLREVGCNLLLLYPMESSDVPEAPLLVAQAVESKRPEAVLRLPVRNQRDAYFLRWPKDAIQSFPGFTAIAHSRVCRLLATRLSLSNIQVSPWCEGGVTVRAGRNLLVSASHLRRRRLTPFPEPCRIVSMAAPCDGIAGAPTHLDLDCAAVFALGRRRLLLFSERYLAAHRAAVEHAAQTLNADIFVVPKKESARRALNLVFLPPAAVLMPSGCPATQEFLAHHLGRDQVLSVNIDSSFNYNGGYGGLGCMSSLIAAHV